MPDFSFTDDAELRKLSAQVVAEPEDFEHWEKLVRAAEAQEGGLNRNSSPQAIAATRDTYDQFLAKWPLFYGFWKRYADLEFSIAGSEAAEMVYERGVASIGMSVDLWTNYCAFKVETNHDVDVIRELFERGAESCGQDFLAHPFWDKFIEFEERLEDQDRIFAILGRIIHLPLHQYSRYFERYNSMSKQQPLEKLASANIIAQYISEVEQTANQPGDVDRDMRTRLDAYHWEIFSKTQAEVSARWTYEQGIKRPYYHVTELDDEQLTNWGKYLDYEEAQGDYMRTKFLYERCLVTAANYDEFWFRYARWLASQKDKQEEVRNAYQRASTIYVPIAQPAIRLHYAYFEESQGRVDVAEAIHEAVLMLMPSHFETIKSLVNLHRRQYGVDAGIELLRRYSESPDCNSETRGALVAEWACVLYQCKADSEGARKLYQSTQAQFFGVQAFWSTWLEFELTQPTSDENIRQSRIKTVHDAVKGWKQALDEGFVRDVSTKYLQYLLDRGGKSAVQDYLQLDAEVNGPASMRVVSEGKNGSLGVSTALGKE
nr:hypothetical protein B0A51_09879 [Rachicladosporium sp. CCFEE 5018]